MIAQGLSAAQILNKNTIPNAIDIQKAAALNFVNNRLNNLITTIPDSTFTSLIKNYSSTGKYDVNDEIADVDLSKIFNFAYDRTEGAILSRVDLSQIDININDLKPSDDGQYNDAINQYEVKPLTTYSSYGGTYGLAEVIPGYKLHAKIIGKDV
jgi:hypothetical protein